MSRKKVGESVSRRQGGTKAVAAGTRAAKDVDRERQDKPLNFHCPVYLQKQIKRKAVEEETTVRATIIRSLAAAGFDVYPEDMEDRRGGPKGITDG